MTTDTSERRLERLICKVLAGYPCDPSKEGRVAEASAGAAPEAAGVAN